MAHSDLAFMLQRSMKALFFNDLTHFRIGTI